MQIVALYCQFMSPIFAFPVFAKEGEVTFARFNFLGALNLVSSYVFSIEENRSVTLLELIAEGKRNGKCIVLFPEGARTNGDGVLEFSNQVAAVMSFV
jgi:hypothetical protein